MATMWRRAMHYLGLGPDDEYTDDQGYAYDAPEWGAPGDGPDSPAGRPAASPGVSRVDPRATPARQSSEHGVTVRPAPPANGAAPVRPLTPAGAGRDAGLRTSGSVRQIPAAPRLQTVEPTAFNDAQDVGDYFKAGQPVAMDLSGVDRELARRLIDFCSGMCYSLGGGMERMANQRYLLVPDGVEVSDEDRRRAAGDDS
jgi:cell division inhibitor SepF